LLLNVPIGQWWGFNTQLINAGSMQNRGIEVSVTTNNIRSKDFSWNSTFNFAYNKQECLALAPGVPVISTNTANPSGVVSAREFTRLEPGKELGVIYGFKYIGVIKTGEKYNEQPNSKPGDPKYADLNGDGRSHLMTELILAIPTRITLPGSTTIFIIKDLTLQYFSRVLLIIPCIT
jgi:outer membrane receptor protein involved in Fe transport